jgi:uncharacterized membrane protein YcaP (DUF421 family)
METNGKLSVFLKTGLDPATAADLNVKTEKKFLPIPLIIDGTLLKSNLPIAGIGMDDIKKVLKADNIELSKVFFMYKNSIGNITTIKKDNV